MGGKITMQETIARLVKVFNTLFEDIELPEITPEVRLREDLGMNSIGMLYMAMELENEFDIRFENDDFAAIKTVGDILAKLGQ
jgi:acyl carrier protein